MAFTNPILAGEELNRTGIRSENYVAGVSGWRIANDGAAEFDNVGLRGNLWVPTITLNGQDLATLINKAPKGVLAWVSGYPAVQTTSAAKLMETEVQVVAGRWYEMNLISITPDVGNTKATEFHIKYTTDGSAPTTSSPALAISLRVSQFEMANVRAMWGANYTGKMRLLATIHSLDGAAVRSWAPGAGAVLNVYDMGIFPPMFGSIGTSPPVKTLREWTITANDNRTFNGDGTRRTDARINDLIAGDWQNGRGNQRAWWSFSNTDQALLDQLIGVPEADVEIAEVYLWNLQWRQNPPDAGYVSLGFHNTSDFFLYANEPPGGIPNVHRPYVIGGGGWLSIKPVSGAVPSNFLDSMRDGYLNGFMVGNTFFGAEYCGVFDGYDSGAAAPKLHMRYWKAG